MESELRRTDLFVGAVCDAADQRRDRAFFSFPDISAEMFTSRQAAEERTHESNTWTWTLLLLWRSDQNEGFLPGGQLVDVTAAVFGPHDDFVGGDELPSGPGLVVVAGHRAEQRVVARIKYLTHTHTEETDVL